MKGSNIPVSKLAMLLFLDVCRLYDSSMQYVDTEMEILANIVSISFYLYTCKVFITSLQGVIDVADWVSV